MMYMCSRVLCNQRKDNRSTPEKCQPMFHTALWLYHYITLLSWACVFTSYTSNCATYMKNNVFHVFFHMFKNECMSVFHMKIHIFRVFERTWKGHVTLYRWIWISRTLFQLVSITHVWNHAFYTWKTHVFHMFEQMVFFMSSTIEGKLLVIIVICSPAGYQELLAVHPLWQSGFTLHR